MTRTFDFGSAECYELTLRVIHQRLAAIVGLFRRQTSIVMGEESLLM